MGKRAIEVLVVVAAAATVVLWGCDKSGDKGAESGDKKGAAEKGEKVAPGGGTTTPTPPTKPGKTPLRATSSAKKLPEIKGPGPHDGFDLKAIQDKLQGTWLVGGSAFSSIPAIWHIEGRTLTMVDPKGKEHETTMTLLAPCHLQTTDDGGMSVWHDFVFAGDTLYSGLGSAGLKAGKKTVGCFSAGVYVHDGEKCTLYKKKSFPRPGDDTWESEPGDCGWEADGKVFYGDDTNSKRKTYGKETLKYADGDALLTMQMKGNKAVKVADLATAKAEQAKQIAAKEALKRPPENLSYGSWGLPAKEVTAQKGKRAWMTCQTRKGSWSMGLGRYNGLNEKEHKGWVVGSDCWAPAAFIHAAKPVAELKPGDPVMINATFVSYARFKAKEGDKLTFETGNSARQTTRKPDEVLPVTDPWQFGAPVAFKAGDNWLPGTVVLASGTDVFVYDGRKREVTKLAKDALETVGTAALKAGAKVLAMPSSGMGTLKFEPGKIEEVKGAGMAYKVKLDSGKVTLQTFDKVIKQ